VKLNINDTVRVRLTDYGRAVLRDDWQSTTNIYYARPEQREIRGEYKPPKEDENGWSEWQLWALMEAFGEHTGNGCRLSFETAIEIVGSEVAKAEAEVAALKARLDTAWGDNAANDRITDRLRADLIAEQGYRAAAEEIAQRRGEMVDALIADIADLKSRLDTAWGDVSAMQGIVERRTAERDALAAEVAALKAHDPLAEMWRELAEYQPQADADGHGESWAKMCSERTGDWAWAAKIEARKASGDAACAAADAVARALADATEWAVEATDAIRRAKEAKP
jgi:hypothetical protein